MILTVLEGRTRCCASLVSVVEVTCRQQVYLGCTLKIHQDGGSVHRGKKTCGCAELPDESSAGPRRPPGASARSVSPGGDLRSPAAEPCSHCTGTGLT